MKKFTVKKLHGGLKLPETLGWFEKLSEAARFIKKLRELGSKSVLIVEKI